MKSSVRFENFNGMHPKLMDKPFRHKIIVAKYLKFCKLLSVHKAEHMSTLNFSKTSLGAKLKICEDTFCACNFIKNEFKKSSDGKL